ncbi:restriction endonuclease subunit S [Galbibacter sp. BG1]
MSKDLNREFLFFWYKSIARKVENDGIGMTVKGFNLNYVKALEIHIPDLETQKDVVRLCSGLVESISVIESYYQQKLINLEDLKKSILQKSVFG